MHFTVQTLPKYRLAYVRQIGPYGPANSQAMEKLKMWAKGKNWLHESAVLLGIPQDNPATTLPQNCRYDACIVVSQDEPIDDSVCEAEFPGGKYAVCTVKHTSEDVRRAWAELFPALQVDGYQLDDKPVLERYTGEMIHNDQCELCVPIKF
ncbi:DNA gyrase inhibitor GyrI [Cohnella sp. OV330]|uniref:AraC family transcriptional regulator n=1 Tax=Cohnella sp. OV330 TaxID=1855288 RepID=UPI0008DEF7D0|nr:GyrI-like domain-containing protein [Cohnella sp. OV330]SFB59785.1 DNA gyrase inhibitor GyrI [Cohnella sp. OV330]